MTEPDTDRLVLVVVGAHPRAELHDRAAAERLRDAIDGAVRACWTDSMVTTSDPQGAGRDAPPRVMVLTDLWRMNDPHLAPLPQVAVGHPEINALSAFLVDKVPPAFVIDGTLAVQFDAQAPEAIALCWGTDHRGTARAVDEFVDRYLASFASAVVRELADEAG